MTRQNNKISKSVDLCYSDLYNSILVFYCLLFLPIKLQTSPFLTAKLKFQLNFLYSKNFISPSNLRSKVLKSRRLWTTLYITYQDTHDSFSNCQLNPQSPVCTRAGISLNKRQRISTDGSIGMGGGGYEGGASINVRAILYQSVRGRRVKSVRKRESGRRGEWKDESGHETKTGFLRFHTGHLAEVAHSTIYIYIYIYIRVWCGGDV